MKCTCHSHGSFLTAKGLQEAAQREASLLRVALAGNDRYLDKVGSVSAVDRDRGPLWPSDQLLLEQSERFLNGS